MITRTWNAVATEPGSRAYARYFTSRVLPRLDGVDGFLGAYLLDREDGDLVAITVVTLWDSPDALAAHTGLDPDAAMIEPEGMALLLDFDSEVTHRRVAMMPGWALPTSDPLAVDPPRHAAWRPVEPFDART